MLKFSAWQVFRKKCGLLVLLYLVGKIRSGYFVINYNYIDAEHTMPDLLL